MKLEKIVIMKDVFLFVLNWAITLPHGVMVTSRVPLVISVPLAVSVAVPGATPINLALFELLPVGIVIVAGTVVATSGALLVRFTVIGRTVGWLYLYS